VELALMERWNPKSALDAQEGVKPGGESAPDETERGRTGGENGQRHRHHHGE
jgi:hypothetical protein